MKILFAPIPLFNAEMSVNYYYLHYQKDGNAFFALQAADLDDALNPFMLNIISQTGLEALTTGKPIFIPVSHVTLLAGPEYQCGSVSPGQIVFVIDKDTPAEPSFINEIIRLKGLGYRFATNQKMNVHTHFSLVRLCDFFFVSIKTSDPKKARDFFRTHGLDLTVIPSEIQTSLEFAAAQAHGFTLFEGPFYRLPMSKGQNTVAPLKINYINLLNIVRDENFDIANLARTVQRDAALSIALLRIVNSLDLRSKVDSIEYAAALIGQSELRKWVTATVSSMISTDKPNEITKLSLIRAKFAENLAGHFELGVHSQSLFLMGLFSVLDIILEMPMQQALNVVRVSDSIRDVLLHAKGELFPVLELIRWYEAADWINASRSLIIYRVDPDDVCGAYLEALKWYDILTSMDGDETAANETA